MDLYDLAKPLVKMNSYYLEDMVEHYYPKTFLPNDELMKALELNQYILKITLKLKLFSLTIQLSQVAGCLWEISLRQARSLRNEILLSYEFY